jgi:hypothetical protein
VNRENAEFSILSELKTAKRPEKQVKKDKIQCVENLSEK